MRNQAISRSGWWNLGNLETLPEPESESTECIAIGFPHVRAHIEYSGVHPEIKWSPNAVRGNPLGKTLTQRRGFAVDPALSYDPSGLSGGPTFELIDAPIGFTVRLVGITANGSKSRLNYIPLLEISPFLNRVLD